MTPSLRGPALVDRLRSRLDRHGLASVTWRRPPTVYEAQGTRHATWLELFFDLVFVVAVAQLGHLLKADVTAAGFLSFAALFLLVWWNWLGFSYYADMFDTDDLTHRIGMLTVMFGVIVLAATIDDVFTGGSFRFAAAYLFLRVLFVGMFVRAWLSVGRHRRFLTFFLLGATLPAVVWAVSLLVPEPWRFVVWGLSWITGIAATFAVTQFVDDIPSQVSHMPERLGLFTIIVLGEVVLAVAVATTGIDWQLASALTALGGFLIAVTFWWTYFQHVDEGVVDRAVRTARGSLERELTFLYVVGHYVVFLGIVTAGLGVEQAIEAAVAGHALAFPGRALLSGGVVVAVAGITVCQLALPASLPGYVLGARAVPFVGAGFLAVAGGAFSPVVLVVGLAATLVAAAAVDGVYSRIASQRPASA